MVTRCVYIPLINRGARALLCELVLPANSEASLRLEMCTCIKIHVIHFLPNHQYTQLLYISVLSTESAFINKFVEALIPSIIPDIGFSILIFFYSCSACQSASSSYGLIPAQDQEISIGTGRTARLRVRILCFQLHGCLYLFFCSRLSFLRIMALLFVEPLVTRHTASRAMSLRGRHCFQCFEPSAAMPTHGAESAMMLCQQNLKALPTGHAAQPCFTGDFSA